MKYIAYLLVLFVILGLFVGCSKKEVETEMPIEAPEQTTETAEPEIEQEEIVQEEDIKTTTDSETLAEPAEEVQTSDDELFVIKILEGIYLDPREPHVKVGQEVVFVNTPVEGTKDKVYTLVGDKNDYFASDEMEAYDQFSHTYTKPGVYTLKIYPGGAGKIYVEE